MKVRLLNDGTYDELSHIEFPVEVEGELTCHGRMIEVPAGELIRLGAVNWNMDDGSLPFYLDTECEPVEN